MKHNIAVAVVGVIVSVAAYGQTYPNRTVRLITSPPGGGTDFPARLVAQGISGPLGQQVVVDGRPTVLLGEIVAKAPPDGYTLLLTGGQHWIRPLVSSSPYDPLKDFAPISMIDRAPVILVVHPSMPVKTVKQLIALAKARPGELNYGSGGPGGTPHLGAVLFNYLADVNIVIVPYNGAAPAMTALIGGEIQATFTSAGGVGPHLQSGRLRALAVGSAQPTALAPGMPTIAASGVPGYAYETLHALFAPAGTPPAIVARLNQEVRRYLATPEAKDAFFKGGIEVAVSSPEELTAIMKSEMANIGKALKAAGVTPGK